MTSDEYGIHGRERAEGSGAEDTGRSTSTEGSSAEAGGPGEDPGEGRGEDPGEGQGEGARGRTSGRGMWTDAFADVQEIVNDVVENVRGIPLSGSRYPRLDLYRVGEEGYRAFVDLPGVRKDEVDVTTMGDELTIEGERRRPASRESAELLRSERGYGHFRRSLRMPPDVDPSGVRAEMHEGVLEIRLPRASQAEAHKVEID